LGDNEAVTSGSAGAGSANFHQRFSRPIAAAMVSYDGLHWPVLKEIDPGLV
jgi:hypothetical protein